MNGSSTRPTAIVAGGGPSGALAAKVLSERGFSVQLYEAYPHPGSADAREEQSKAYVISVSPRGQLALTRCGVDPMRDLDAAVASEAVVRHGAEGKKARVLRPHGSILVRRRALAASLLRAAEEAGAEVHCAWKVTDIDFEKRRVKLEERESAAEKTVGYDLLVGADGVRSKTRTLLSNHLNAKGEGFTVKTIDDTMEYQVAVLPRPWAEIVQKEMTDAPPLDTCPPASMHSWADTKLGTTALGFPLREANDAPIDKFLVCLICPEGLLGKWKQGGFSGYTSALPALFSDWTPDSRLDLARLLAAEANTPSTGGVCVWSQALSHPESGVVLMGDAGHGMWPSLGQGCNAALESASVFADAIEAVTGSVSSGAGCRGVDLSASSNKELVEAIAIEYDGLRQEDALAVVDLTYGGIGGTKVRGRKHSPVMFKVQIGLFMLLNKLSFGVVPMPAMFRIMKGDYARYSVLKRANRVEKYVAHSIVAGVLMLVVSKFL
ncbi:hypothetical protein ACHAXT_002751 [Thalassiosira profunda]